MMLSQIDIRHLRKLFAVQYQFHPRFNIIHGPNGSGKTSVLEALYMLSTGHSFRTREITPLITHGQNELTLYASTCSADKVSIKKSLSEQTRVKINHQPCLSSSELTHWLPCQVIYQEIFQIIDAGPSVRRAVLDWGMFHVKPSYHVLWKQYKKVLKQRNALLRQKASRHLLSPWNQQMVELAEVIHRLREDYIAEWAPLFNTILQQLSDVKCHLSYFKGWDKSNAGKKLSQLLDDQYEMDLKQQYTHSGVHQADILFVADTLTPKLVWSRGQQKIMLIALKISQALLLAKPCLYLMDDISSELDENHLNRLLSCLHTIAGQFFITALNVECFGVLRDVAGCGEIKL